MLTMQEIEVFLVVAEQGGFSSAARLLHLSQPTVSQTIQNLENRFESRLFERHRRGVRLTDEGAALLPMAHELMTSARRLEENMAILHGTVVGKLTIGCSTASGKYLLPRLIRCFREQYPAVRVDVLIRERQTVLQKLLSGEISFGISSKKIEHGDLQYLPFYADEVVLIVPTGHAWAGYGRVYPDDLLDVPLIIREPRSGTTESVFDAFREHDISPDMLNIVMELGNAEAIAIAVEEQIGVAFISRLVAEQRMALGGIAEVSVEGMTLEHQLHFARNLRLPMSRSQSEFWEFVQHNRYGLQGRTAGYQPAASEYALQPPRDEKQRRNGLPVVE